MVVPFSSKNWYICRPVSETRFATRWSDGKYEHGNINAKADPIPICRYYHQASITCSRKKLRMNLHELPMSEHHPLKTFLNIHLASDVSVLLHLPFVLDSLTSENLAPSSHLPKWIARVQSLLHSKETGGRWAGMVLAQKTVLLSQGLLLEYGQSWAGVALLSISVRLFD